VDRHADALDRPVSAHGRSKALTPERGQRGGSTISRVAVIGGGWAGLAAAVALTEAGRHVTLLEMAPQLGGRARRVEHDGEAFDNGQHILIGAYVQTLALMRRIGADPEALLQRQPLTLRYPEGHGLRLPSGPAVPAFVRGVLGNRDWRLGERLALLRAAAGWRLAGFRCDPALTVAQLCAQLPAPVRADLIEPLCVAALNTPAQDASATVLLRVLRDALFSGPGAADLLLPRRTLDELLPQPAETWLRAAGADIRLTCRAESVMPADGGWAVNGERFDGVVLAASASESGRMTQSIAPTWSKTADDFGYEPIVTVWLEAVGLALPAPMLALHADDAAPAQFVFDHGQLSARSGRFAFVISGAAPWVARGRDAAAAAVLAQARSIWPAARWRLLRTISERRATFRCTPGLSRPPTTIAPGLAAAGDYTDGPYPATLEGAVRSGLAAAAAIQSALPPCKMAA
jgi:hydroxysqualene dehydroxylase